MNDRAEPSYPISSVDNALRVLAWLRDQSLVRTQEIADRLDLGRSSAQRVATALEAEGFLSPSSNRRDFIAGPVLARAAAGAVASLRVRRAAHGPIRVLRDAIRETVELCILDGPDAVVIDVAEGLQPLRVVDRPGDRLSAHLSAAGKAMLASLDETRLKELFPSAELTQPTPRSLGSRDKLEAELGVIAQRGYATNRGEGYEDFVGVAAPVVDASGILRGAITVALPRDAETMAFDELATDVIGCAQAVGRNLDESPLPEVTENRFLGKSPSGSVGNALRILSLVSNNSTVRVSEAADALGVAPGTAHRLIAMLVHRGFLEQAKQSKAYRPGAVLVDIGLRLPQDLDLRTAARPHLEALARETGETSGVAVVEGDDVRIVDVVPGTHRLRVVESAGRLEPARTSAAGRAILASSGFSPASDQDLAHELAEILRLGYAVSRSGSVPGASGLATVLYRSDGTIRGAAFLSLPTSRWPAHDHTIVDALLSTARLIEADLG